MLDLWPKSELLKLRALTDQPYEKRIATLKLLSLEADKTLMRIMDLLMLMNQFGAEAYLNYEPLDDGKTGDISIGCKMPNHPRVETAKPRFEPEPLQDNIPGSIH